MAAFPKIGAWEMSPTQWPPDLHELAVGRYAIPMSRRWVGLALTFASIAVVAYILAQPWGRGGGRALGAGAAPLLVAGFMSLTALVYTLGREKRDERVRVGWLLPGCLLVAAIMYSLVFTLEFVGSTWALIIGVSATWEQRITIRMALIALTMTVILYLLFVLIFNLPVYSVVDILVFGAA
jgi:hypothetical protein